MSSAEKLQHLAAYGQAGQSIGKPPKEQAEIARLIRQLAERDLETTKTALDNNVNAHALLEQRTKSADSTDPKRNDD